MADVDLGFLREDLNEVGLIEASEDLQEDQEQGHERRDLISWKGEDRTGPSIKGYFDPFLVCTHSSPLALG